MTDIDLQIANGKACVKIRDLIMRIAKYISEVEGCDRIFSEMVDHSILNI